MSSPRARSAWGPVECLHGSPEKQARALRIIAFSNPPCHHIQMEKELGGYVYMMTNERNTTLYTGVTNDLPRRVLEHRALKVPGFTKKYNCVKLVYWDWVQSIEGAIILEKKIKRRDRAGKDRLVDGKNPSWRDLATDFNLKPLPERRAV